MRPHGRPPHAARRGLWRPRPPQAALAGCSRWLARQPTCRANAGCCARWGSYARCFAIAGSCCSAAKLTGRERDTLSGPQRRGLSSVVNAVRSRESQRRVRDWRDRVGRLQIMRLSRKFVPRVNSPTRANICQRSAYGTTRCPCSTHLPAGPLRHADSTATKAQVGGDKQGCRRCGSFAARPSPRLITGVLAARSQSSSRLRKGVLGLNAAQSRRRDVRRAHRRRERCARRPGCCAHETGCQLFMHTGKCTGACRPLLFRDVSVCVRTNGRYLLPERPHQQVGT